MKHFNIKATLILLMVCFVGFTACKNDKSNKENSDQTEKVDDNDMSVDDNATQGENNNTVADQDTINVQITAGDQMKFDQTELTVYEGQTVVLTFKHTGKSPKASMGHNFTLLKKGTNASRFAREAVKYHDNDYLPEDNKGIIAHTKLLGGGESDTITFKAPKKGTYDYICTFPGHANTMHGKFIVK